MKIIFNSRKEQYSWADVYMCRLLKELRPLCSDDAWETLEILLKVMKDGEVVLSGKALERKQRSLKANAAYKAKREAKSNGNSEE